MSAIIDGTNGVTAATLVPSGSSAPTNGIYLPTTNAVAIATNGETDVTYTAGSPFTAYNQLTQAEVIGWVQAALGATQVSALEAQLDAEIAAKISPQNTSLPLPWSA